MLGVGYWMLLPKLLARPINDVFDRVRKRDRNDVQHAACIRRYGWLVFNGTFRTNRLYRATSIIYIYIYIYIYILFGAGGNT